MKSNLDLALVSGVTVGVDTNSKTINGAKVIELGGLNDSRNLTVDEETLGQVLMLGNAPNKGIKVRYTHPGDKEDGIGKHLGRATNFRRDGNAVYADISLAAVAFSNPDGNYGQYILDFALEDPEAFGLSLSTKLDVDVMLELMTEGEPTPIRFERLKAVDFVGDPAATRGGLFEETDEDTTLDKENNMSENMFEKLEEEGKLDASEVKAEEAKAVEPKEAEAPAVDAALAADEEKGQADLAESKKFVEEFGDKGAVWFLEGKSLEECKVLADLSAKEDQIAKLSEQVKVLQEALESNNLSEVEAVSQATSDHVSEEEKAKLELKEGVESNIKLGMTSGSAEAMAAGLFK